MAYQLLVSVYRQVNQIVQTGAVTAAKSSQHVPVSPGKPGFIQLNTLRFTGLIECLSSPESQRTGVSGYAITDEENWLTSHQWPQEQYLIFKKLNIIFKDSMLNWIACFAIVFSVLTFTMIRIIIAWSTFNWNTHLQESLIRQEFEATDVCLLSAWEPES